MGTSSLSDWCLRLIAEDDFGGLRGLPNVGFVWKGFGVGYWRCLAACLPSAGAPQPCQAGARANIRLMFHAMVTRLHSPRAPLKPRSEN